METDYLYRLIAAAGMKLIAALYVVGIFWLVAALMHYLGIPWVFCIVVAAVTIYCELDWNTSFPLVVLRLPFPKRFD